VPDILDRFSQESGFGLVEHEELSKGAAERPQPLPVRMKATVRFPPGVSESFFLLTSTSLFQMQPDP